MVGLGICHFRAICLFKNDEKCFFFFLLYRELDPAFLRRFERKMLFGLPDSAARIEIIKQLLPKSQHWPQPEMLLLSELALDFTGDDIRVACKEASMKMVRNAIESATKCN